jgi:transcriptional regulator with XRE-family HTH domain
MSQEQLAAKAAVGSRTIQRMEKGCSVHPSTLALVANSLEVETAELVAARVGKFDSLVHVHRDLTKQAKKLLVHEEAPALNSQWRIEIAEISDDSTDGDDFGNPVPIAIQSCLRTLGFKPSMGRWPESGLLSKRSRKGVPELFVVHEHNQLLATKLQHALTRLNLGMVVSVLTTAQTLRQSSGVPRNEILGNEHALVAYRAG